MSMPTDSKSRKQIPLAMGLLAYFPNALAAVARVSQKGNDKHNPGQPLHWSREKSNDHLDSSVRHITERVSIGPLAADEDGEPALAHAAWRILAQLQLDEEEKARLTI